MSDRYDAGNEGEFQPGSNGQVLRNKLGVTDPADMDEAELVLLENSTNRCWWMHCPSVQ